MTWSNNIKVDAIGLAAEVVDLRRELEQQAVLLGKGSEREARLMAENAELQKENAALREALVEFRYACWDAFHLPAPNVKSYYALVKKHSGLLTHLVKEAQP